MKYIKITMYVGLLTCLCAYSLHAQVVGVNTTNAQKVFHIDGAKDNATSGVPTAAQLSNDVIIDQNGNMGIGLMPTQYKLDILTPTAKQGIRLRNGSEKLNKVLTSDYGGNGVWQYPGTIPIVTGKLVGTGISIPLSKTRSTDFLSTSSYIDLPPGTWYVHVTMTLQVNGVGAREHSWLRSTFLPSADIVGSQYISGQVIGGHLSKMSGYVVIKNSTANVKRYTYYAGYMYYPGTDGASLSVTNFGGAYPGFTDNLIFALQMVGS